MPTYTPWTWSQAHKNHYSYMLSDEDGHILQTFWSGPTSPPARGQVQAAVPASLSSRISSPTSSAHRADSTHPSLHRHGVEQGRIASTTTGKGKERAIVKPDTYAYDARKESDEEEDEEEGEEEQEAVVVEEELENEEGQHARNYTRIDSGNDSGASILVSGMARLNFASAVDATKPSSPLRPTYDLTKSPQVVGPQSTQWHTAFEPGLTYDPFPSAQTNRSAISSLPKDVQQNIRHLDRRYIQTGSDRNIAESLDHRFRRVAKHHHAAFFAVGRVFKMLWTEPAGQSNPGRTRNSTHFSTVWLGEQAYSEIRYFVVVRNKGSFSQCIPIQTYGKKGATKAGTIMRDHSIIHTSEISPTPLPGEHMTKYSIRVVPNQDEALDPHSRLNFGKAYAVEHNVKVLDIGLVLEGHRYMIQAYFDMAMRGD